MSIDNRIEHDADDFNKKDKPAMGRMKSVAIVCAFTVLIPFLIGHLGQLLPPAFAFYVRAIGGIIFLGIGMMVLRDVIAAGFILGGGFTILSGYLRYVDHMPNMMRFMSLLAIFCFIIVATFVKSSKR